jgi:hypothetical protein
MADVSSSCVQLQYLLAATAAIEVFKQHPTEIGNLNLAKRLVMDARQVPEAHTAGTGVPSAHHDNIESLLCVQVCKCDMNATFCCQHFCLLASIAVAYAFFVVLCIYSFESTSPLAGVQDRHTAEELSVATGSPCAGRRPAGTGQ